MKKQINIQMDQELYEFITTQAKIKSFTEHKEITISEIIRDAVKRFYGFGRIKYNIKTTKNGEIVGYESILTGDQ